MIKVGSNTVIFPYSKIYVGDTLVWQNTPPAPAPAFFPDYIEATGTQYIDLNYTPDPNGYDVIETEFALTDASQGTGAVLFGRTDLTANYGQPVSSVTNSTYRGDGTRYYYRGRRLNETVTINTPDTNKHTYKEHSANGGTQHIVTFDGADITCSYQMAYDYLFANKYVENGTYMDSTPYTIIKAEKFIKAKIYGFKVTNSTTLGDTVTLDLTPVVDTNGDVGMYDSVSGTIFYNAGTGTFLYGNDT